jgi:hypothetical protein
VTGGDLLLQANATALEVVEMAGQGQVDGHWCLWRTIMGGREEAKEPA